MALGAVAAVCVLGGVLAIAIVRAGDEPEPRIADGPVQTSEPAYNPPPEASSEVGWPTTTTTTTVPTTDWVPPSSTAPAGGATTPPYGYRVVSGPEGIELAIPAEWAIAEGAVPSNLQADSPSADKLIRFGGSASTSIPLLDTVATNETGNPNIADGYQRIRLEYVTTTAEEAVDWEFVFVKDGITKHSYGRYWRLGGIDYVVYASTSDDLWYSMSEVIDVMVSTAGPMA